MPDKGTCEHGFKPWWDCDVCRSTSMLSTTLADRPPGSDRPLVLGENLLPDGTVRK